LEDSNEKAGQDVDAGDQNGSDGIALVETRGAVHGPVELGFAGCLFAAGARLMFVDESGIEVGVDGHLLAGQRVESEARGDFGGAHRAVADHDVLDGDEGNEENEPDDVVAADDELPEGFDDASGGPGAFVAVQQDAAAGREFSDRRNKVSRSSRLGKTENCAGRRICSAESRTSTDAAKLVASRRSSAMAGNARA